MKQLFEKQENSISKISGALPYQKFKERSFFLKCEILPMCAPSGYEVGKLRNNLNIVVKLQFRVH